MKITKEFLEDQIQTIKYHYLTKRMTVCIITTSCGYEFLGKSACVDEDNFDAEIGQQVSYENAFDSMWEPYGLALRQSMYEAGI